MIVVSLGVTWWEFALVEGFEEVLVAEKALSGTAYRFVEEEEKVVVVVVEFAEAGVELVIVCAAGFGTSNVARELVEFEEPTVEAVDTAEVNLHW